MWPGVVMTESKTMVSGMPGSYLLKREMFHNVRCHSLKVTALTVDFYSCYIHCEEFTLLSLLQCEEFTLTPLPQCEGFTLPPLPQCERFTVLSSPDLRAPGSFQKGSEEILIF